MKYFSIIILLLVACESVVKPGDSSTYSKTIKEQAEALGQLLLKQDFKSFTKYTYPKIMEMMGGEQKMIEAIQTSFAEMESQGTSFLSVTFGEPSKIIIIDNELQCTLPQTIEMKVPNGRLVTKSTLIAISDNHGKNWYFLDTSGRDIQALKKTLPNLSAELVIPEKQQPAFYND